MSGSPREFNLLRINGASLAYLGSQISDLHSPHGFIGRKLRFACLISLIGMDFGINWLWPIINWGFGFDLSGSRCTLDGLSSRIMRDTILISEGLKWIEISDLSVGSDDFLKPRLHCLMASFLPSDLWRILRVKAFILGKHPISVLKGSGFLSIYFFWKLLVFKGRDRVSIQSQSPSFLFVSFLSFLLSASLSIYCGIPLQCFLSVSLCAKMPQSSLLGKDSVEKSLGAVVSKMRIKNPKFDNSALIKGYAKTMIGRCMNPRMQDMRGLLLMFPRICQVEGRVAGADLGVGRFQLDFDEEEDIEAVLKMEPFHFDGWMVSLVRWKPSVDPTYPSTLTFWIQVLGIPIEYWAHPTFESIGDALGKVVQVDLNGGRVQVILDGYKPLCFETTIEFDSGEETLIPLRYERLYGYCSYCFSMCHDVEHCEKKYGIKIPPRQTLVEAEGAGAQNWSYKGAVVQDRQPKHGSEGKGKGIASGTDREEERSMPSNSQVSGFGKGKQSKYVQGEGSSRNKRFTNYANFNDHSFNEQKKLKARAKDVSKVKVVDSAEAQAVQAVAYKPKKIVRKALVFEDVAGLLSEQQPEHKEPSDVETQVVDAQMEAPTDQVSIQTDLEMGDLILDTSVPSSDAELPNPQLEEGVVADGDLELDFEVDADIDSADLLPTEAVGLDIGAEASELVEEVMGSIAGDDNMEIIADQGAAATKINDKGKGKEGSLAKKKVGRGIVLPGVTTRKRIVQALVSPRKRSAPKNGSNQGDEKFPPNQGPDKGGPGGSQPPQTSA